MSKNKSQEHDQKKPFEGDALLIQGRVEQLERDQSESRKREEEYKRLQVIYNRRLVWFTGGLVIIGIITNCIYYYLAVTSRRSADAAKLAADAAKASADISQRQVRAYVSLRMRNGDVLNYNPAFKRVLGNVTFTNSGQSPARHVVTLVGHYLEPAHEGSADVCRRAYRIKRGSGPYSESVMAPQGTAISTISIDDDGTEWKRIQAGQDTVCAFGTIFYDDIFDVSHETEFCIYWLNGGAWGDCAAHNEVYDYPQTQQRGSQ